MTEIIQLDGYRTGPKRIADRVAMERDRVETFNRHMIDAGKLWRAKMWQTGASLVHTTNDATVYQHRYSGERLTGIQLDPSGSGFVPTHWERVTPLTPVARKAV